MDRLKKSICIATYNGENFVEQQILSILPQLKKWDEIIIVDDCSTDNTLAIVQNIEDKRIKVYRNGENIGHVSTFERAIQISNGDIIFLSDQDDLWPSNRINIIMDNIDDEGCVFVGNFHNFNCKHEIQEDFDRYNAEFSSELGFRKFIKNLFCLMFSIRPYFGCCIAFSADLKKCILPMKNYTEAHDHWIVIVGMVTGKIVYSSSIVTFRRLHEKNVTPRKRRSIFKILRTRIIILRLVITAFLRSKAF